MTPDAVPEEGRGRVTPLDRHNGQHSGCSKVSSRSVYDELHYTLLVTRH